jgi:hypothetical protein
MLVEAAAEVRRSQAHAADDQPGAPKPHVKTIVDGHAVPHWLGIG